MGVSTICGKLQEATEIKEAIRQATANKDVTIPADAPFSEFPALIASIPGHLQQGKTLIPTAEGQTALPDSSYDGFKNIILPEEVNLIPKNIRLGVDIFGVDGTMEAPTFDMAELFSGDVAEFAAGIATLRNYAFYNYPAALKKVTLDNLTNMGTYAFYGCVGITLASMLKLETVASYAFNNCTALVSFLDNALKTIDSYAFSGCQNLATLDLSKVTEIKDYGLNNCRKVANIGTLKAAAIGNYGCYYLGNSVTDGYTYEPEEEATIGSYGFEYARITELIATIKSIGSCGVAYCPKLTKLHAKITGQVQSYGLAYNYYVDDLDLSQSTIDTIGTYAFYQMGYNRTNPSENRLSFDFRNSKFSTVDQYAFAGSGSSSGIKYADIHLPDTVKTMNQYAFRYINYTNVYVPCDTPPTLQNGNIFNGATNYKVFIPYNHANAYYTASYWSAIKTYLVGYAPAGTFTAGETLPIMNGEGMALTWYSDADKTNVITKVIDANAPLYCDASDRAAWVVDITADENTTLTLVDNTGASYTSFPAYIPIGRSITLDLVAREGWGNNTTVNGTSVTLPYTVALSTDLTVRSNSWEGDIDPNFTTASWANIKKAVIANVASNFYSVGTTRTVTLKNGKTITLRIANNSGDYYERADGSMTGFVLEFVDLWPTSYYMNPTSTNAGGWDASYMRQTVMPLILEQLPDELVDIIATVKVKACKSGTDATIVESLDKIFLPAEREIFVSRIYSRSEEWDVLKTWQYYINNNNNAARIKKQNSSASWWWERSPYGGNSGIFCGVGSNGTANFNSADDSYGVAPGFCI
ncbi:MAG: leucine-rich repeat protein [Lachnospiraceae bacterium]|nr:leucine-rich repeat protein [Lachnospiraceae bacterium]